MTRGSGMEPATGIVGIWMWRPGMNSKQGLAYDRADPQNVKAMRWCDHTHRTIHGAEACGRRMAEEMTR